MHSVYEAVWVAVKLESMRELSDATDGQISAAAVNLVERRVGQTNRRVYMPVYVEVLWPGDEDPTDA
jgi:hypothetical protein